MTDARYIGLHCRAYITPEQLNEVLADVQRVAIIVMSGIDTVRPLERLALELLRSSGRWEG